MADNNTKVNANIDGLNAIMRCLKEDWTVRIGILGSKATAQHDSKSGLTNAKLGAVHEFGADISHPGGTPYKIVDGKARFVKKSEGEGLPVTKAHNITIPQRSFLQMPLEKELPAIIKKKRKVIFTQIFDKKEPKKFFMDLASDALFIVQTAFSEGRPEWRSLTAATKRRKAAQNLSPNTLVGEGTLSSSITTKVFKK